MGLVCWGSAPWIPSVGLGMAQWAVAAGTWTVMGAAWWREAHLDLIKAVGLGMGTGRGWGAVSAGTGTGAAPQGWTATAGIGIGVDWQGVALGTRTGVDRDGTAPWVLMTAVGIGMMGVVAALLDLLRMVGSSVGASWQEAVAEPGTEAACQAAAPRDPMAGTGMAAAL